MYPGVGLSSDDVASANIDLSIYIELIKVANLLYLPKNKINSIILTKLNNEMFFIRMDNFKNKIFFIFFFIIVF
jgi:hypothetical protein